MSLWIAIVGGVVGIGLQIASLVWELPPLRWIGLGMVAAACALAVFERWRLSRDLDRQRAAEREAMRRAL